MESSLVALLTRQIVTFVRDNLAERLSSDIDAGHQDGKETLEIVTESLDKLLAEMPKTAPVVTPVYSAPQTVVGTTPVTNGVVQTAPKTTSTTRSTASDVLKDDQGNPIKCEAVVKKTSAPCKNNAKHRIGGQCVCGLHAKSANSAQPDANKAPKTGGVKAPPKGTSSFGAAVGMPTNTSNSFGSFSIDNTEDISVADEDENL